MNSTQIDAILRCDKRNKNSFLGVFPADKFPDKPRKKKFSMVINCCPSQFEGIHWTALFVERNKQNQSVVNFFCSFGQSPKKYNFPLQKYGKIIRFNTNQIQLKSSDVCGAHCIFFIQMLNAGISYKKLLNEIYSLSKSRNDKMVLLNLKMHLLKHKNKTCLQT